MVLRGRYAASEGNATLGGGGKGADKLRFDFISLGGHDRAVIVEGGSKSRRSTIIAEERGSVGLSARSQLLVYFDQERRSFRTVSRFIITLS